MPQASNKKTKPIQTNFPNPHEILMDAPMGIFTSTPEGRYISVNPAHRPVDRGQERKTHAGQPGRSGHLGDGTQS